MTNLSRLRRAVELATDLSSVVGTMKTLAAVNSRQFDTAAEAIDVYVQTVELALSVVLREVVPEPPTSTAPIAYLVLGADQGMCGAFNERLAGRADEELGAAGLVRVVVIGHRVARRLEARGWELDAEFRSPGSVDGVTGLVGELLNVFGDWQDAGELGGLRVISARSSDRGGFDVIAEQLLPVDQTWVERLSSRPWSSRGRPTHPHDAEELFRWLLREWLFARLYLACASSLAAENTARLLATQAAQRALNERVVDLRQRYRTRRQQAITQELLDLHR